MRTCVTGALRTLNSKDIARMPKKRRYTDEQKIEAAVQYCIKGNMKQVSRDLSIPDTTLGSWKHSPLWDTTIASVRAEKTDEHIARYTGLIDKLLIQAEQDIPNMRGKDAIISAAVLQDKSRTLQSLPTSINVKVDMDSMLKQFEALSSKHQVIEHEE